MDHQKSNFSLTYGTLSDGGRWGHMRSKKFQMVDQAQTSTTQETTEHQFLVDLSKHLVKPGLYFISIPSGWPCITVLWADFVVVRSNCFHWTPYNFVSFSFFPLHSTYRTYYVFAQFWFLSRTLFILFDILYLPWLNLKVGSIIGLSIWYLPW